MAKRKTAKRDIESLEVRESLVGQYDHLVFGVIVFSKNGLVKYHNSAAKSILGPISKNGSIEEVFPKAKDEKDGPFDVKKHLLIKGLNEEKIDKVTIGIGEKTTWLQVGCSLERSTESLVVSFHECLSSAPDYNKDQISSSFKLLFDEAPIAIQIYDRGGTLVEANGAWEKLWGLKSEDVVGWYNVLKDKAMIEGGYDKEVKKALEGKKGMVPAIEFNPGPLKGVSRWVSTRYFPLSDASGYVENIVVFSEDVSAVKKAEMTLRNSESRFRNLFENAGHGMAIADSKGIIRDVNKQGLQMLGYQREEIVNQLKVQDITHPDDLDTTNTRLTDFFSGKTKKIRTEKRYLKKNGDAIWVAISTSKFQDPSTGEQMIIGVIDDITQSRRALAEIKSSELKFRSIFEEAGHGIALSDETGTLANSNKRFRQMFGYTKKDIKKGVDYFSILHPQSKKEFLRITNDVKSDASKNYEQEVRCVHKSGKEIVARLNLSAYLEPGTRQVQLVFIFEDITKRKEAQRKLKASEQYQHQIINALSNGLMVVSPEGRILQVNAVWLRIAQRFPKWKSVKPGNNFFTLMSRLGQDTVNQGVNSLLVGESSDFEMEIKMAQKTENWFSMRASKLQDSGDLVITLQEITVRKRVEKALEESLSNYRNIYNMTPVMMHSIDPKGKLVSVSNFWLEKLGYQRHEVIGRNIRDFLTEDSKKDADIILPVFFEKGSIYDVTYHFLTKSGEVLETILSAIEEGRGTRSARSLAVVSDVTPLKKAERQLKKNRQDLLQAQSIARIGSFELNVQDGTFTSSGVFDEILEIDKPEQKQALILKEILVEGEFDRVYDHFKNTIFQGKDLEVTVRAVTLKTKQVVWLSCLGRTVMNNDRAVKFVGTVQDVTKGKLAELEIQGLSDSLKLAMTGANIGVWEMDLKTSNIQYEDTMYQLFELPKGEKLDTWRKIIDIIHEEDRSILTEIRKELRSGESLIDHDFRVRINGEIRHYRSMTRQVNGESDRPEKLIGVIMDITRDKELVNQLEASLKEKDTLVKEVHHRVKNNMQMISSILALKALDLNDDESKMIFDECTMRIKSMAVVHDQLYRFYNVSEIEISAYLDHLLSGLNALMGGKNFVIIVNADASKMNVDTALLCGLIVSEMVANAFKHGFKDVDEGIVTVNFFNNQDHSVLEVINTGHPVPQDIIGKKLSSLGMSLIKTFTTQLEGKLSLHEDNGFRVAFRHT